MNLNMSKNKKLYVMAGLLISALLIMVNVLFNITFVYAVAAALIVACLGVVVHAILIDSDTIMFYLSNGATMPSKRDEDAGYDIYACFESDWIRINPNETTMIPTGIISAFNDKYVAVLKERGSTGTKGIGQRCGVIDSGFRGEWMVPITNHNDKPIVILKSTYKDNWLELIGRDGHDESDYIVYPYNKAICQMLLLPVPKVEIKKVSKRDIFKEKSERGMGLLGSSGK